jgi:putative endopeptidase
MKTKKQLLIKGQKRVTRKCNVFSSFEHKYQKKVQSNELNIETALIKMFKTPFTKTKCSANSDFYTYINYKWIQDTMEKYEKGKKKYFSQIDDFRILQDKVFNELLSIVTDEVKYGKSPLSRELRNVYNSLVNLDEPSVERHMLNFDNIYQSYIHDNNLWKMMASINRNEVISWGCPIYWNKIPDDKNSKKYINIISLPQLTLYDDKLYNDNNSIIKRYLQYIGDIFKLCSPHSIDLNPLDVVSVERQIVKAMNCKSGFEEDENNYNLVLAKEALPKYGFDWSELCKWLNFKKVPDKFICDSTNYLKCICKLLSENWNSKEWKSFWYYIHFRQMIRFHKKGRLMYYEFNGRFLQGQQVAFPTRLLPVFGLSLTFNTFLTNEYVKRNESEQVTRYVKNMGKDLLLVFQRILKRNTWLSENAKKQAILKLENIELIIGKPKSLREDPLLGYSSVDTWENILKITDWRTDKFILLEDINSHDIPIIDWHLFKIIGTQSYVVNAYYTPNNNSIYLPLAYLQKPFVDLDERGIEYNLARIGFTLAHEMSHAIDDMGSKFDYTGVLHDWLNDSDKRKLLRIQNDITKQYEAFALRDGIEFDASIAVGENMADISGLAICEEYLRDFQDNSEDIIPIRDVSFQAFFIYFAVQQRQHIYRDAVKIQLKTNPHPLDKYRTNVPLSRMELFKSIFNVKKGDGMYWKYLEISRGKDQSSTNTIW